MPRLSALAFSMGTYGLTRGGASRISTIRHFAGSDTWTVPAGVSTMDWLIVAGGGSGGSSVENRDYGGGGGGGAGGVRLASGYPVTPGDTWTVVVGGGGTDRAPYVFNDNGLTSAFGVGIDGSGTYIENSPVHIGANGGGGGGTNIAPFALIGGRTGGCGGGAANLPSPLNPGGAVYTASPAIALTPANGHTGSVTQEDVTRGTNVQGFDGGAGSAGTSGQYNAGGGGGATSAGRTGGYAQFPTTSDAAIGSGGNALASDITGVSRFYGGGGGGGAYGRGGLNSDGVGGFGGGYPGDPRSNNPFSTQAAGSGLLGTGSGGGGAGSRLTETTNVSPYNAYGSGKGGSGTVVLKYSSPILDSTIVLSGSLSVVVPDTAKTMDYLVVSGGGGGGRNNGGGGGGGGIRLGTGYPVNAGDTINAVVGAGAAKSFGTDLNPSLWMGRGLDGSDSYLHAPGGFIVGSNGGGGGASGNPADANPGRTGGCGGGAAYGNNPASGGAGDTGTINSPITSENTFRSPVVQGYAGGAHQGSPKGSCGAGGGGAAGAGANAGIVPGQPTSGGDGGEALKTTITGTLRSFSGGGGGATTTPSILGKGGGTSTPTEKGGGADATTSQTADVSGEANTGGGGGGTSANEKINSSGGSGIIILKFNAS